MNFVISFAATVFFLFFMVLSGVAVYFWLKTPNKQHLISQDWPFRFFVYYGAFFTWFVLIGVLLSFVLVAAYLISGAINVP